MLRPERMSKVSVTGSRAVMPVVIETVYKLNRVHLSDYDGSWDGFDNGNPIKGADEASGKLVTVRALESTLDLESDEQVSADLAEDWEERLERVRTTVNDLDDTRQELREELRQVEEQIDRVAPFAELGIDLDLLSGYDYVDVVVGEGDRGEIEAALEEDETVRAFDTFTGGDVIAIVAAPTEDAEDDVIVDALVGVEFTRHEVPDVDRGPSAYVGELEDRKRELERELADVDAELEAVKADEWEFLLRVEAALTIEVQQAEAPLQFATTERAFVAEGWIPTAEVENLEAALRDAVGESVEFEEIERADYEDDLVHDHDEEEVAYDATGDEQADEDDTEEAEPPKAATDGGRTKATDGGSKSAAGAGAGAGSSGAVTMDDQPPVILDNLTPAKPFEIMVEMVSHPRYSEVDPTLLIFLTYPFAFGFMIGDIGYGLLYMAMGYGMWKYLDSDAGKALGTIGIWAGVFTLIFGWLYDDLFGVHMEYFVPEGIHNVMSTFLFAGSLDKGLQLTEWALLWIVLSVVFGLIHLNLALILGFINELGHGMKAAVLERGSWILAMNGLFLWIFSTQEAGARPDFLAGPESVSLPLIGELRPAEVDLVASNQKPEFMVGTGEEAVLYEFLGFAGIPELVGIIGITAFFVGAVMVGIGEGITGLFEIPAWTFGHVLSYLRMVSVLLAKGGMAFVVNLLVFGGYSNEEGYTYFNLPTIDVTGYEQDFVGIIHADPWFIAIPAAILIFVLGHVLVLVLGITAAGIQMLRLEWVEFMQKFYEGGGEEYEPFGDERVVAAD